MTNMRYGSNQSSLSADNFQTDTEIEVAGENAKEQNWKETEVQNVSTCQMHGFSFSQDHYSVVLFALIPSFRLVCKIAESYIEKWKFVKSEKKIQDILLLAEDAFNIVCLAKTPPPPALLIELHSCDLIWLFQPCAFWWQTDPHLLFLISE